MLLLQEAKLRALIDKAASVNALRQNQRAQKMEKGKKQTSIKDRLAEFKLEHLKPRLEELYGVRTASFARVWLIFLFQNFYPSVFHFRPLPVCPGVPFLSPYQ
jgi:hypothetical protein